MHFGQDRLDDFDWSNKADDAPVSLALMATNSEYIKCLRVIRGMLKTHEKNEYAWGDKYEQMEYDLKIRDLKLEEKQKELDQALKERDDFKVKLEKWSNAVCTSKRRDETLDLIPAYEYFKEKRPTKQNHHPTEATEDEAVLWHRRRGMSNFKKKSTSWLKAFCLGGLPSKTFKLESLMLACRKCKQHMASCKKIEKELSENLLKLLHMDFVWTCFSGECKQEEENQKGKGPDWMFDLDLLTPSMNYIPVRKENYADSKEQGISCDDVEDLDDQQFINLMPSHNDDQRIAFEEEKRRISIVKGKEHVNSTFTLSTANTPPQSTGNTPTDSDDDISKDGIFSTNSFDAEEGGVADYNNMDPTIDVPSYPNA
ncbi:hypothetical protein Tco_0088878 [Tanacetum coccineum]